MLHRVGLPQSPGAARHCSPPALIQTQPCGQNNHCQNGLGKGSLWSCRRSGMTASTPSAGLPHADSQPAAPAVATSLEQTPQSQQSQAQHALPQQQHTIPSASQQQLPQSECPDSTSEPAPAPAAPRYGGYCACCGGAHFLGPTPATMAAAAQLRAQLDSAGRIDVDDPDPDPELHIDYVWTKGPGRMFGVMLALDPGTNPGADPGTGSGAGGGRHGGQLTTAPAVSAAAGQAVLEEAYGLAPVWLVLPEGGAEGSEGSALTETVAPTPPVAMGAAAAAAAGWGDQATAAAAVEGRGTVAGPNAGSPHPQPQPHPEPQSQSRRAPRLVLLKAFSGQMTNRWHVRGWAGPVAGVINTTPLYARYRSLTEAYSARLAAVESALAAHLHSSQPQPLQEPQQRQQRQPEEASPSSSDCDEAGSGGHAPAASSGNASTATPASASSPDAAADGAATEAAAAAAAAGGGAAVAAINASAAAASGSVSAKERKRAEKAAQRQRMTEGRRRQQQLAAIAATAAAPGTAATAVTGMTYATALEPAVAEEGSRRATPRAPVAAAPASGEAGALGFLERQRQLLRGRRRALSHELLRAIQRSYVVGNFRGRSACAGGAAGGGAGGGGIVAGAGWEAARAGAALKAGASPLQEPLQPQQPLQPQPQPQPQPQQWHGEPQLMPLLQVYDCAQRRALLPRVLAGVGGGGSGSGIAAAATAAPGASAPTDTPDAAVVAAVAEARQQQQQPQEQGQQLSFPAGTGDCCAPKLLWAAQARGLVPVGLVEFWYGSPPNTATPQGRRKGSSSKGASEGDKGGEEEGADTNTRVHGRVYGPCDKCEAILGSMLCGL